MPNFNTLSNRVEAIKENLINQLKKDLPNFDIADFFQVFGKTLEDNLSIHGKNIYATGLDPDVLREIHLDVSEKLNQDYQEILANAATELPVSFDATAIVNNAKKQLKIKLEASKKLLLDKLNAELTAKGQEFTNPADKKELNTAFINYLNQIGKKYETSLGRIESIGSQLAKLQLHLSNEDAKLKARNPKATFAMEEIDLDNLSIGVAPAPVTGLRVHKDNLAKQILSDIASGKNIDINVIAPDRYALIKKMADIGFQHNSPFLALLHMLIFTIFGLLCDNDEKRVVTAIKQVIEENQLFDLDLSKITLKITSPTANGKEKVTREKGPLKAEDIKELQSKVDDIKNNLQKHSLQIQNKKFGSTTPIPSESGYNTEDEENRAESPKPRGP